MEAVIDIEDRRRSPRQPPEHAGWRPDAILRPGLPVLIVNVGPRGALLIGDARMRPGYRTELQLCTLDSDDKRAVLGRIARCRVVALNPLRFEGAIEFETPASING